jgi:hypothetical protein
MVITAVLDGFTNRVYRESLCLRIETDPILRNVDFDIELGQWIMSKNFVIAVWFTTGS